LAEWQIRYTRHRRQPNTARNPYRPDSDPVAQFMNMLHARFLGILCAAVKGSAVIPPTLCGAL
jgi:hypothetical protein